MIIVWDCCIIFNYHHTAPAGVLRAAVTS
jgi:hypothetical protein